MSADNEESGEYESAGSQIFPVETKFEEFESRDPSFINDPSLDDRHANRIQSIANFQKQKGSPF